KTTVFLIYGLALKTDLYSMKTFSGSMVVTSVIFIETENKFSGIPLAINCFAKSNCKVSRMNLQVAFLRFLLICLVVKVSPRNPKNSRFMAISTSSENRSIKFQHLLNEVPPLKDKFAAYGKANNARKTAVTH